MKLIEIAIGNEYLFPRYKTYCADNIMGYAYHMDDRPYLLRVSSIDKMNQYLTKINFFFLGTFLEGEYCVVICDNAYYDELHNIFKKKDHYDTIYPERDLNKIFFNTNTKTQEKINTFLSLKENHQKMIREMEELYRAEMDKMIKELEDFDSYDGEMKEYVNERADGN